MRGKKSLLPIEQIIKDQGALPELESLLAAGCNRNELLTALSLVFRTDSTWQKLVGTGLRTYKRNIQEIEACANLIENLNRSELLYHLSIEYRDPRFAGIHISPTLPEQLREFAVNLAHLPELFGPKHTNSRHAWKAWIVAMVIEDTGKPHDSEVAALVGTVLENHEYDAKAHQEWRLKYVEMIKAIRNIFLKHRGRRLQPPPSA